MGEAAKGTRRSGRGRRLRRIALGSGMLLGAFLAGRADRLAASPPAPDTPAIREAKALHDSLDTLEAQLNQSHAWVAHQAEMARRHLKVSAVVCEVASEHAREALELAERQARRNRQRQRAAKAPPAAPAAEPSGTTSSDSNPEFGAAPPKAAARTTLALAAPAPSGERQPD